MASAAGAVALGLALIAPPASATHTITPSESAEQAVSVDVRPSSGLSERAEVTVSASGFETSTSATALQCAQLEDGRSACNVWDFTDFELTDGSGSTTKIVTRTFPGYVMPDGPEVGTVDCSTAPGGCSIVVGGDTAEWGETAISFR